MRLIVLALCAAGCAEPPDFTWVQTNVLTPSCSQSSCHGAGRPPNGLALDAERAYKSLFEVSPTTERPRVVAHDPDASLLIQVLQGPGPESIRQMPIGGSLDALLLEEIRDWISAGARE